MVLAIVYHNPPPSSIQRIDPIKYFIAAVTFNGLRSAHSSRSKCADSACHWRSATAEKQIATHTHRWSCAVPEILYELILPFPYNCIALTKE